MNALQDLRDFIEERYDTVDGEGACDRPSPNEWMRVGMMLDEVVAEHAKVISKGSRWIPVSERAPEGTGVLCIVALDMRDGVAETMPSVADFHNGRFEVYDDKLVDGAVVTHWQPLGGELPSAGAPGVQPHTEESLAPIFQKLERIAEEAEK